VHERGCAVLIDTYVSVQQGPRLNPGPLHTSEVWRLRCGAYHTKPLFATVEGDDEPQGYPAQLGGAATGGLLGRPRSRNPFKNLEPGVRRGLTEQLRRSASKVEGIDRYAPRQIPCRVSKHTKHTAHPTATYHRCALYLRVPDKRGTRLDLLPVSVIPESSSGWMADHISEVVENQALTQPWVLGDGCLAAPLLRRGDNSTSLGVMVVSRPIEILPGVTAYPAGGEGHQSVQRGDPPLWPPPPHSARPAHGMADRMDSGYWDSQQEGGLLSAAEELCASVLGVPEVRAILKQGAVPEAQLETRPAGVSAAVSESSTPLTQSFRPRHAAPARCRPGALADSLDSHATQLARCCPLARGRKPSALWPPP
jgi:hypothetical protein